jgi:26S proteasome regulatory subunit N7
MNIEPTLDEQLKKLDEKLKDAEENLGDVEVRDTIYEKAALYEKHKDYENAVKFYESALKKSVGVSKKLEVQFALLQMYLQLKDLDKIKGAIERCKQLLEEGGDWERKNKLKVYEGLFNVMIRNFRDAATLFLDAIPTFNSPEVVSFNELVFYTISTSMVSLERSEIRKKVIHSPDILSVIKELPELKVFLDSFYKCDYKTFFFTFVKIIDKISADPYLQPHKKYFVREMRLVIYSQFLESYKTVTLENMAQAFGVSSEFIDKELSAFIASRRLNCKIDKISGLIESQKVDKRNNLYQTSLKKGDYLFNKLQKLSRVIDV